MGINKVLMSGQLQFDNEKRKIVIVDKAGGIGHSIGYDEIEGSDWGYVYERHVGLHFEAAGYSVSYRGATLGFLDGGIDLTIEKGSFKQFIQCKYGVAHRLSKQRIEVLHLQCIIISSQGASQRKAQFRLSHTFYPTNVH